MKAYRTLIIGAVICAMGGWFADLSAKPKCVSKIYAFGFSASFNDSTVYFTDIHEIDSVWIDDKTNFLMNRESYSYQLKNYFINRGESHRTCVITFASTLKDINKKYEKMKNKYVKAGNFAIRNLSSGDFKFSSVKPDDYQLQNIK